jgi:hypothetical protein
MAVPANGGSGQPGDYTILLGAILIGGIIILGIAFRRNII